MSMYHQDLKDVRAFCEKMYRKWRVDCEHNRRLSDVMENYAKERVLNMIFWPNVQRDPSVIEEIKTFWDEGLTVCPNVISEPQTVGYDNAETGRKTLYQLQKHVCAMKHLVKACRSLQPLTVALIKDVHFILMDKLITNDGQTIQAGCYRDGPLKTGDCEHPPPEAIHGELEKIVSEYNERFIDPEHDKYNLASWLLYRVVCLRPFQDGNGRISRLLLSYSLMKDGLPFPVTLTSGHKVQEVHHYYVQQIVADSTSEGQPHLTKLTLFAVCRAWNNFYQNMKFELND